MTIRSRFPWWVQPLVSRGAVNSQISTWSDPEQFVYRRIVRVAMVLSIGIVFAVAIGCGVAHQAHASLVLFPVVVIGLPLGMVLGRRFVVWKYPAHVRVADANAADRSQGYHVPPPAGPPAPKALSLTRRVVYTLIDIEAYAYFAFFIGLIIWGKAQPTNAPDVPYLTVGREVAVFAIGLPLGVFNLLWITRRHLQKKSQV